MGCDFYIHVYLEIQHINGISYCELPTIRGYYCELDCGGGYSDDDENEYYYNSPEYLALYAHMKTQCLTPRRPVAIYAGDSFISPKREMKYLPIIRNKMNNASAEKYNRYRDTGSFTRIDQVITVVKKEERYDPYDSYLNK